MLSGPRKMMPGLPVGPLPCQKIRLELRDCSVTDFMTRFPVSALIAFALSHSKSSHTPPAIHLPCLPFLPRSGCPPGKVWLCG